MTGEARQAGLSTADSVSDIALASGFNSLSNFNRRFRQFKGITPLAFRNLSVTGA